MQHVRGCLVTEFQLRAKSNWKISHCHLFIRTWKQISRVSNELYGSGGKGKPEDSWHHDSHCFKTKCQSQVHLLEHPVNSLKLGFCFLMLFRKRFVRVACWIILIKLNPFFKENAGLFSTLSCFLWIFDSKFPNIILYGSHFTLEPLICKVFALRRSEILLSAGLIYSKSESSKILNFQWDRPLCFLSKPSTQESDRKMISLNTMQVKFQHHKQNFQNCLTQKSNQVRCSNDFPDYESSKCQQGHFPQLRYEGHS